MLACSTTMKSYAEPSRYVLGTWLTAFACTEQLSTTFGLVAWWRIQSMLIQGPRGFTGPGLRASTCLLLLQAGARPVAELAAPLQQLRSLAPETPRMHLAQHSLALQQRDCIAALDLLHRHSDGAAGG